jgi:hypothetical protein
VQPIQESELQDQAVILITSGSAARASGLHYRCQPQDDAISGPHGIPIGMDGMQNLIPTGIRGSEEHPQAHEQAGQHLQKQKPGIGDSQVVMNGANLALIHAASFAKQISGRGDPAVALRVRPTATTPTPAPLKVR